MEESPGAPLELTVDEAMKIAVECQQNEQLDEAAAIYRKVLEVAPERADVVHFAGVLAHQQGRSDEALAMVERSLQMASDRADWHSNLGIVRRGRGDMPGAIEAYERAIALDPLHANAHSNLGVLLRISGRHVEAEAAYRKAIALDPGHADAYQNLAVLLSATDRVPEAVKCYCRALTLKPGFPEARRLLALAYCLIDQRDKAVLLCEEWVAQEPDDAVARHTLAACSGRDVPVRASDAYIERTFDSFSSSFEVKLAQLHYQAPSLVAGAVADAGVLAAKALDVLDAGCGTGLCGPLLAPYARRLVGVDLSEGMLRHAREKNTYDELVKGEMVGYVQQATGSFDLVVSADTLVYFGSLDDIVVAAAAALRPGGLFVFTVEEALDAGAGATYDLKPNGRYTHTIDYVERVLVDAGLHADVTRAELRLESGLPVQGLLVRATKPALAMGASAGDLPEGALAAGGNGVARA